MDYSYNKKGKYKLDRNPSSFNTPKNLKQDPRGYATLFAPPQIHGLQVGNCMNIARAATVKYADHIIRLVFSTTSSPINLTLSREYLLISIAALLAGSHTKEHDLDSLTSMAS